MDIKYNFGSNIEKLVLMVEVYCPSDNWNERAYIVDVILKEFLGIEYHLNVVSDKSEYRIVLNNQNEIIIQDHFFSKFKNELDYLSADNFPTEILQAKNQFIAEDQIPVLFGTNLLEIKNQDSNQIIVISGLDLFSSSFFMLTRWEEHVSDRKDYLGRFSALDSIAFTNSFLDRPIVNEYADFLWNLFDFAGINQERKRREFKAYITHDVDYVLKWYSFYGFLRTLGGDIFKRRSIKAFFSDIMDYTLTVLNVRKDPYNTFDNLMSLSEEAGFRSYFFFMSVEPKYHLKHFRLSHPFVKKLINEVHNRGHHIGFHPDIDSFKDPDKWRREKEMLQDASPQKILCGRQHFLQIDVPGTWQIWNDMGMEWDSTLSYDEIPGFRTGTCYSYNVFNFLTREVLELRERPLTIMDKSLVIHNKSKHISEMERDALCLIDKVNKHQGEFVLLWHNNCFNVHEWKPFEDLYPILIKYLCSIVRGD